MTLRTQFALGVLLSIGLILTALFFQHVMGLEPCPLCIVQRIIVIAMGIVFLIAFIQNPQSQLAKRIYGLAFSIVTLTGVAVAGRHVWLQHLPADKVPECSPGLDVWISMFPLATVVEKVFQGAGECAEVVWQFLGLSIPEWTLILFSILALISLKLLFFPQKN